MQDRVSNHPGRWVLTPVTGQSNTYDFTRADDPTVVGTALNKANLLTDATVAAINALAGSTPATPNEALSGLASALAAIGMSNNVKLEMLTYTGSGGGARGYSSQMSLTFSIKPRIVIWGCPGFNYQWYGEGGESGLTWIYPYTRGPVNQSGNNTRTTLFFYTESNKTLTWYASGSGGSASDNSIWNMDASGKTYYVFAIGVKD